MLGDCIRTSSHYFAIMHGLQLEDMEKAPAYAHALATANRQHLEDICPSQWEILVSSHALIPPSSPCLKRIPFDIANNQD
ncbi:hypothetical protein M408DRAFT_28942 [Serendipita vermifera MAFF 305830]|uniref:Uncharacterized protein n=1 Tax=Serendipita vermifera MAFF 305830 TaxID=933852 RepID=A0A0C2WXV4_SERVB|nr:hypothetical protein M408DRAFT_28942 [Serendipita vermifera MAFF 305830]